MINLYIKDYYPIRIDVTSIQDTMQQYKDTGYNVTFELNTPHFKFEGNCQIFKTPLTAEQIHEEVKTKLIEDFKGI